MVGLIDRIVNEILKEAVFSWMQFLGRTKLALKLKIMYFGWVKLIGNLGNFMETNTQPIEDPHITLTGYPFDSSNHNI